VIAERTRDGRYREGTNIFMLRRRNSGSAPVA